MIDSTKVVERNVSEMLLNSIIVIKGIISKGPNKGNEYATIAIERGSQYDKALAELAVQAGADVIDVRNKG